MKLQMMNEMKFSFLFLAVALVSIVELTSGEPRRINESYLLGRTGENSIKLMRDQMTNREASIWDSLLSNQRFQSYKPYHVYEDVSNLLNHHGDEEFNYSILSKANLRDLHDFKHVSAANCTPPTLESRRMLVGDPRFRKHPNLIHYLSHYQNQQEILCWSVFELELSTQVNDIPSGRRKFLKNLRRRLIKETGLQSNELTHGIIPNSEVFLPALARFMVSREVKTGNPAPALSEPEFTKNFKKLMFKPCRDIEDATHDLLLHFDQIRPTDNLRQHSHQVLKNQTKQTIAISHLCDAIFNINHNSIPSFRDLYQAYRVASSAMRPAPVQTVYHPLEHDDDDGHDDDDYDDEDYDLHQNEQSLNHQALPRTQHLVQRHTGSFYEEEELDDEDEDEEDDDDHHHEHDNGLGQAHSPINRLTSSTKSLSAPQTPVVPTFMAHQNRLSQRLEQLRSPRAIQR